MKELFLFHRCRFQISFSRLIMRCEIYPEWWIKCGLTARWRSDRILTALNTHTAATLYMLISSELYILILLKKKPPKVEAIKERYQFVAFEKPTPLLFLLKPHLRRLASQSYFLNFPKPNEQKKIRLVS